MEPVIEALMEPVIEALIEPVIEALIEPVIEAVPLADTVLVADAVPLPEGREDVLGVPVLQTEGEGDGDSVSLGVTVTVAAWLGMVPGETVTLSVPLVEGV